jgi:hypothetical protein
VEFMLQSLDMALKIIFVEGDFVWESCLEKGFPRETFWYLYGMIK